MRIFQLGEKGFALWESAIECWSDGEDRFEGEGMVAESFLREDGVGAFVAVEVSFEGVGELLAKDAMIHVSVK